MKKIEIQLKQNRKPSEPKNGINNTNTLSKAFKQLRMANKKNFGYSVSIGYSFFIRYLKKILIIRESWVFVANCVI